MKRETAMKMAAKRKKKKKSKQKPLHGNKTLEAPGGAAFKHIPSPSGQHRAPALCHVSKETLNSHFRTEMIPQGSVSGPAELLTPGEPGRQTKKKKAGEGGREGGVLRSHLTHPTS